MKIPRFAALPALFLLASVPVAQRDSEFMKKFRQALSAHDLEEMARLVDQHETDAVRAIIETCEMINAGSSDQLEDEINGLGKAWKKAFDSKFVDLQYEYFSLLSGNNKNQRQELIDRYRLQEQEYYDAVEDKAKGRIAGTGLEFEGLSGAFQDIGDDYMASTAAYLSAVCFDDVHQGENADFKRSCDAYGRALKMRERIDLKDTTYDAIKVRFDELEFLGFGDPSKGPEARRAAKAESDPRYAATPVEASFEPAPELADVRRLIYFADEIYPTWPQIGIVGREGKGTFPILKDGEAVVREGAAKAGVDTNADGSIDVEIPVNGRINAVTFEHQGAPWAFLAVTGTEKDTYQGIQPFNLAPNDNGMNIYVAPAASIVTTVAETRVQILDDNMDGVFGSAPIYWPYLGLQEGSSQVDFDAIIVGDAKRARPWSELVQIGDDWYKFERNEEELLVNLMDVETGTLALDMDGLSCEYLVVKGRGGVIDNVYVDVAADRKGVEVPVGSYEIVNGLVTKGSRSSMMKALICPGEGMSNYAVTPGETTTIELGKPFSFDFDFEESEESFTVKGSSIVVVGRGQETYQRLWNCVPRPDVSERRAGTKKGSKGEGMSPATSQELSIEHGWNSLWFPIDMTLEKKKPGEPIEVQLVEKKHKLFGSIESDWKAK